MVQMMTKVLHVNQQHKLHGVDDDMVLHVACMVQMMTKVLHVNQQLHGVDDKGTSCKSTTNCMVQMMTKVLHVNQQHKLHGAWCR